MSILINEVSAYFKDLQNRICTMLEKEDSHKHFNEDHWTYPSGGGGQSRVLENGNIIEKGGVNFSHIIGDKLPAASTTKRPELADHSFQALGISLVIHPDNPFIPTSHANLRLFVAYPTQHASTFDRFQSTARRTRRRAAECTNEYMSSETSVQQSCGPKAEACTWWFGGGFDLTPYYGNMDDCIYWHEMAKKACDPFGKDIYPKYKKWCDEYFYLKHRQEARGIGGLFFDDLNHWDFEQCFAFVQSVGEHYLEAYQTILQRRKNITFNEQHKKFQRYRRGRYVEFNLLYDRGTLFGLQSNGRTESILMSLPPSVEWQYQWQPDPGSAEAALYSDFLPAREWVK